MEFLSFPPSLSKYWDGSKLPSRWCLLSIQPSPTKPHCFRRHQIIFLNYITRQQLRKSKFRGLRLKPLFLSISVSSLTHCRHRDEREKLGNLPRLFSSPTLLLFFITSLTITISASSFTTKTNIFLLRNKVSLIYIITLPFHIVFEHFLFHFAWYALDLVESTNWYKNCSMCMCLIAP